MSLILNMDFYQISVSPEVVSCSSVSSSEISTQFPSAQSSPTECISHLPQSLWTQPLQASGSLLVLSHLPGASPPGTGSRKVGSRPLPAAEAPGSLDCGQISGPCCCLHSTSSHVCGMDPQPFSYLSVCHEAHGRPGYRG